MFKNYFTLIYRNLLKNKVLNGIDILSLAVGMAACLLVFLFAAYENSYDEFHQNAENIYRVNTALYKEGKHIYNVPCTPCPMGPALKANFPEVEDTARVVLSSIRNLKYKDKVLRASKALCVDTSFLKMFFFPLLQGDPATALSEPATAVLSESFAKNLFGQENPIGKQVIYKSRKGDSPITIKGIFKEVPQNSHLQFMALFSIHELDEESYWKDNWNSNFDFRLYVSLNSKANPKPFAEKIIKLYDKHRSKNVKAIFELQPIKDIQLYSGHLIWEDQRGNYKIVYFFLIIGLAIIIISWINHIILTTGRSVNRAQEVGMRKVVGATRKQLIQQFLLESLSINILGVITALVLVKVTLPGFNRFFNLDLSFSFIKYPIVWLPLLVIFLLGTFLSGIYPAFVLSSYKPISVLSGKLKTFTGGNFLKKALLTCQIAVAVFLIAVTFTLYKQLDYMNKTDLGINIDNILLVLNPTYGRINDDIVRSGKSFINELCQYQEIKSVSSSNVPGESYFTSTSGRRQGGSTLHRVKVGIIDHNFVDTYAPKLIAGRFFSKEFSEDAQGKTILLNEKAVNTFGFESPQEAINQVLIGGEIEFKIVGVLKNYHQVNFRNAIEPVCFRIHHYSPHTYFSVKLNTKNLNQAIDLVKSEFKEHFPDFPLEYRFLDEFYQRQYGTERKIMKMFGTFSFLALFIATIGLWGMSTYSAFTRTKEIGIRKVHGATTQDILIFLSKGYIKLIAIAYIIMIPIAYFVAQKGLQYYAYKTALGLWFFLIPILVVLFSTLVAIGYQVFKAAVSNPVESLSYE